MQRFEIVPMSDEIARRLIASFPLRRQHQEIAMYERDSARWLREKGLPRFGYNLFWFRNSFSRILLGTYPRRNEAEQALSQRSGRKIEHAFGYIDQ